MSKLKVLDLFSGIGGFSLAMESAGMETAAFCEIEEFPVKVLKEHWPNIPNLGDIKKLTGENIYERVGRIDVICGGFPCQSVSVAGNQEGFENKEKSGLWIEYKRIIKEVRPEWIVIENVRNLLNIGFAEVLQDLCEIGYDAEWEIISARSVGARHLRERIWIVAYPNFKRLERTRKSAFPIKICEEEKISSSDCGEPSGGGEFSDSNVPRFWPSFASEKEKSEWWTEATACIRPKWEARPSFRGVVDGLSPRMERHRRDRIKALGNSIVPQIAFIIARRIIELEEMLRIE